MARTVSTASKKRRADASESTEPFTKRVRTATRPSTKRKGVKQAKSSKPEPKQFALKPPTTRLDGFVCGEGSAGELGLGPTNSKDVEYPRLNRNLDAETVGDVDLATGGMHAVALTHDNKVLTCGINENGALARDTDWEAEMKDIGDDDSMVDASDAQLNPLESTPTAVSTRMFPVGTKFVWVGVGGTATFALTSEGRVYGWGFFRNAKGKDMFSILPNGALIDKQPEPMLIPHLHDIVDISAGENFCLALSADGTVYSWGFNEQNQLGRRVLLSPSARSLPGLLPGIVPLPKQKKFVSVHAGTWHAFAIDSNGEAWAWGSNTFGQTGIPSGAGNYSSTIVTPQKVASLAGHDMLMIAGGLNHSIGVSKAGECLVWGRNDTEQLGLDLTQLDPSLVISERGKPRILLQPVALRLEDCVFAAAGPDYNLVRTKHGKAFTWW